MEQVNDRNWFEKYGIPLSLVVSIIIATVGWIYTSEQARINDFRKIKNEYISDAYRNISYYNTLLNHELENKNDFRNFERALKNIQLYGSKEENQLLEEFMKKIKNEQPYDLDPLLNKLRKNFRNQYGLEPIDGDTWWIIKPELYNDSQSPKKNRDTISGNKQQNY